MEKRSLNNLTYFLLLVLIIISYGCNNLSKNPAKENNRDLALNASNKEIVKAFNWAKEKALSYAHDNTDPVKCGKN